MIIWTFMALLFGKRKDQIRNRRSWRDFENTFKLWPTILFVLSWLSIVVYFIYVLLPYTFFLWTVTHLTWLKLCVTLTKVPPINKEQEEAAFLGLGWERAVHHRTDASLKGKSRSIERIKKRMEREKKTVIWCEVQEGERDFRVSKKVGMEWFFRSDDRKTVKEGHISN